MHTEILKKIVKLPNWINLSILALNRNPNLFKARATKDTDLSSIGEAMSGPYREEFREAMINNHVNLAKFS